MIDWMTLKMRRDLLDPSTVAALSALSGRTIKINPDGSILYDVADRTAIRSDSHQISLYMGNYDLEIYGSPARVQHSNNVFGSGDPLYCAAAMIQFIATHTGEKLEPDPSLWRCTRIDVTHNYDLGDAIAPRQALSILRQSEGGRFQVKTVSETVYWNKQSSLRAGKAYHKGPHLRHQCQKRQAEATDTELVLADNLLRLELVLRGQYWRERAGKPWHQHTETDLNQLHTDYFSKLIGNIEVIEMDNLLEKMMTVAPTKGRGRAAYQTWLAIKALGFRNVQDTMAKETWHKHKKIMFLAGLTFADFHAQNIVPFRRRVIELGNPVTCWEEIRKAA